MWLPPIQQWLDFYFCLRRYTLLIDTHIHHVLLKARSLTLARLFLYFSPIFLGICLGYLIARGDWFFSLALAAVAPLAMFFAARPFIGIILWLLLMPLSSALPNSELMYWGIHRLLIPFTLCMTLIPHLLRNYGLPRFRFSLSEVCIALLAAYVPVSLLLSDASLSEPLRKYLDRFLIPFCMYLIVRFSTLPSKNIRLLQWAACIIAFSQCAIAFLAIIAPQYLPYAWRPLRRGYAAGSLLNPNVFAIVLGFCLCLLFQAAMDRKRGAVRYIFIIVCGLCLLGIFLSMERAAWLACVTILLGLLILYPKTMFRFLLISFILLGILGGGFLSNYISAAINRFSDEGPIGSRLVVTDAMLQMIQLKPVTGWGYETLNSKIDDFFRQVGSARISFGITTSHNTFLTILTELGLVGFLLYLLPVVWLLITSLRTRRGPFREVARIKLIWIFWLIALFQFIVSNFMDMRFFPIGITIWWMNIGFIANILNEHARVQRTMLNPEPYPRDITRSYDEISPKNK